MIISLAAIKGAGNSLDQIVLEGRSRTLQKTVEAVEYRLAAHTKVRLAVEHGQDLDVAVCSTDAAQQFGGSLCVGGGDSSSGSRG